jgi:cell division septation protein DedD
MIQDDNPDAANAGEAGPAPESLQALPPAPANPKPKPRHEADAPDMFAVGIRVLRMAPAWLLAMTAGCSALVLLLSWMNAGGVAAVARPSSLNDARSSQPAPAADAAGTTTARRLEPTRPANVINSAPASAGSRPAPATAQAAAPAPAVSSSEQTAPPVVPPQSGEKVQTGSPARGDDAGAKFTVQVGSFNNQSEANERVSGLRAAGFDARAVAVELQGRGTWYRVQVGRFADRDEAAKTTAGLRAKGAGVAIVVPLQN